MITTKQYANLDDAFKYFNEKLFDGKLPDVMITLQMKVRTNGYHHFEKFEGRDNKKRVTEIALNPDNFNERTDQEVLSTLCHEMCHHWQYSFSEPARKGYHDKEWANKMLEIGLIPTATGEVGGKMTGQRIYTLIMEGGKFEIACGAFLTNGSVLNLNGVVDEKVEKERKKTRYKFTCPNCMEESAWAKKTAKLACGTCLVPMVIEEEE